MAEKDRIEQEAQDIYNQYYTQQNDPAKAGSDAFRRAVASQLRQSYQQQRETGQSYSDLYQQARRQATRMGAMSNASGFSGGMARGQAARASAAEIQALSGIAAQREGAMREIAAQRQAIPSNALIEAQQADQYARAIEAANLERQKQISEILGSVKEYEKLSARQKAQLRIYGVTDQSTLERVAMVGQAAPGPNALEVALSPLLFIPRAGMQLGDAILGQKVGTTEEKLGLTPPPSFYGTEDSTKDEEEE